MTRALGIGAATAAVLAVLPWVLPGALYVVVAARGLAAGASYRVRVSPR